MRPFLALMCVAAVTVPSCIIIEAEPTNFTSVALHIPDFQSSLRFVHASVGGSPLDDAPVLVVAHRPSVVLGLRGRPAEEAIASGARLVRLADGASVPMSVRSGLYDVQGRAVPGASTTGWSFVPDEPLEDGWHLLRVDLAGLIALGQNVGYQEFSPRDGDVLYSRFRVDSAQEWVNTEVRCERRDREGNLLPTDEQRCTFAAALSEEGPVSWEGAMLDVRYDGVTAECGALETNDVAAWRSCALPPSTDVEITLELLGTASGGPVGPPPTRHTFAFESVIPAGQVTDLRGFSTWVPVEPNLGLVP